MQRKSVCNMLNVILAWEEIRKGNELMYQGQGGKFSFGEGDHRKPGGVRVE